MKNIQLLLAIFILGISMIDANAQIHEDNAYLKNDYIQMAISPQGVYGASNESTIAPGYYSPLNSEGNGPLGLIASPNNAWPVFYGDFMLPGSPYEGISLVFKENGVRQQYLNSRDGHTSMYSITPQSPAFVYNSDTTMNEYTDVTWYGQAGSLIQVACRFQLVGSKVIHYTTIKNISNDILTDIYFARGVDPDQEAGFNSGGLPPGCGTMYETFNVIESQADGMPNKPSWIAAYGYCTPAAIAYYCEDTRSRVGVCGDWYTLLDNPELAFGIGTKPSNLYLNEGEYSRTEEQDWAIELAISVGDLASGDSVTLIHEVRLAQPSVIRFEDPLTLTKNEGDTFTYNLVREYNLDDTVHVTVRLTGISNAVAADFVGIPSLPYDYTIVFESGDTAKTLSIQAAYDCLNIDYKTFELEIVSVTSIMGGLMSPPSVVEGVIRDIPSVLPVINPITGINQACTGATTQLYNTTTGGIWKSANPAVATINNGGLVTGVSAGTATIWYIVTNGCTDSVSTTVTVIANVTPSISISASANNICSGINITYTAVPVNGGTSPAYQWKKNGVDIDGATATTYTYAPANGDVITCELTSSADCATNPVTSSNVTMIVISSVVPSVRISATPN